MKRDAPLDSGDILVHTQDERAKISNPRCSDMRIRLAMVTLAVLAIACSSADGNDSVTTDGVQIVQVAVHGNEYAFSPASVQAGVPVRLVFDPDELPGCSRSVTLPEYDIVKTMVEGDATIEFTPSGAGPVAVACTMNMYTGTLVAE
jgi:plastocyanin domain-containing protein